MVRVDDVMVSLNKVELEIKQKLIQGLISQEQAERRMTNARRIADYLLIRTKEGTNEE